MRTWCLQKTRCRKGSFQRVSLNSNWQVSALFPRSHPILVRLSLTLRSCLVDEPKGVSGLTTLSIHMVGLASCVPLQVAPVHDSKLRRAKMPGFELGFYLSLNIGPVKTILDHTWAWDENTCFFCVSFQLEWMFAATHPTTSHKVLPKDQQLKNHQAVCVEPQDTDRAVDTTRKLTLKTSWHQFLILCWSK